MKTSSAAGAYYSHSAALPLARRALIVEEASFEVAKSFERAQARATARPVQSIFAYLGVLTSPALGNTIPLPCIHYYS